MPTLGSSNELTYKTSPQKIVYAHTQFERRYRHQWSVVTSVVRTPHKWFQWWSTHKIPKGDSWNNGSFGVRYQLLMAN